MTDFERNRLGFKNLWKNKNFSRFFASRCRRISHSLQNSKVYDFEYIYKRGTCILRGLHTAWVYFRSKYTAAKFSAGKKNGIFFIARIFPHVIS